MTGGETGETGREEGYWTTEEEGQTKVEQVNEDEEEAKLKEEM